MIAFWTAFGIFAGLTFSSAFFIGTLSGSFGQTPVRGYFWLYLILSSIVVGLVAGLIALGIADLIGMLFN